MEEEDLDLDRITEAENDALRRHARADFRLKELQQELQDLKQIVDNNDQDAAFKKVKRYRKNRKSTFGEISRIDRRKDYSPESLRIEYESLYGEVESADSSTSLRDDGEGNEDDIL